MKLLFLILIIISLPLIAHSQILINDSTVIKKNTLDSTFKRSVNLRMRGAGDELRTASTEMAIGILFMVGGGLGAAIGSGTNDQSLVYIGGAVAGVGLLFDFAGIYKIGSAGRKLQNSKYR